MRIVLDTNVFISGVFFTGPPHQILKAWRDGQVQILVSPEILEEYSRVGSNLASRFKGVDLEPFLELMAIHSEMIIPPAFPPVIQEDPSDDKFLQCAVAGNAAAIVSGDKHMLKLCKFRAIWILRPREFVLRFLKD